MNDTEAYTTAMQALLDRYRSQASSKFVDLKRTSIRAHALVEGEGEPVILVHGGGGNASNWAPIMRQLAGSHRVIAIDRPGCGLSGPFDYRGVDLIAHGGNFMEDVLDAFGLERAALVGNSMGGLFCAAFATSHPERVEQLVLVGSPAGASSATPLPLRIMGTPIVNRVFFATVGRPSAAQMRRTLRMLLVAHPERVTGEMIEAMWRGAAMPHARVAWRTLLEDCNPITGFRKEFLLTPLLSRIATPTLWLWGALDKYAPTRTGRALAASMPRAEFIEIPSAGHLPWLDDATRVATHIDRSLLRAK
jgi:pimeloyl-ACP methyl ester carboxylesterase